MNKKILLSLIIVTSISTSSAFDFKNSFYRFIKFNAPLVGEDLNKNGIRDDVEESIKRKFSDENRQTLAFLWAHHYETILRRSDDHDFAKKWWKKNERLDGCSMALEYYGLGISISDAHDDRYWIMNTVYNRSNRWDEYINWYNETYYLGNVYQKGSSHFNYVVTMRNVCPFEIIKNKKIQFNALNKMMKKFSNKKSIVNRLIKFEKKFGTGYRDIYQKYLTPLKENK